MRGPEPARLSRRRDRLVSLVLGVPAWGVLGLAAWLVPAEEGHGTHLQLGLSTCTLLDLTGWPCPMCGMTTTFAHLAHGHLLDGVRTQPFGVVLFAGTVLVALVALAEGAAPSGRWQRLLRWLETRELPIAGGLLLGLIGGWIYKILIMKILA